MTQWDAVRIHPFFRYVPPQKCLNSVLSLLDDCTIFPFTTFVIVTVDDSIVVDVASILVLFPTCRDTENEKSSTRDRMDREEI